MIEKPNIMLATKNTGRLMVNSDYHCKKQKRKMRNEVPFLELVCSSNNLKTIASEKSPTKSTKDLHGHSNHIVGSNEWA